MSVYCALNQQYAENENQCPIYETTPPKPYTNYTPIIIGGTVVFAVVLLLAIAVVSTLILFRVKKR